MFKNLFASAVEAFTSPIKTNLEITTENWEEISNSIDSIKKFTTKSLILQQTHLSKNLNTILKLVLQEEADQQSNNSNKGREGKVDSGVSCLDYLIQERTFSILVEFVKLEVVVGFREELINFFTVLIRKCATKLLPQLSTRRPIIRLVYLGINNDLDSVTTKDSYVSLLESLILAIELDNSLLSLFLISPSTRHRRNSSLSSPMQVNLNNKVIKSDNTTPILILLVALLNYIGSSGSVGQRSRTVLLHLLQVMVQTLEGRDLLLKTLVVQDILLEQLTFLFTTMPTSFNRRKRIDPSSPNLNQLNPTQLQKWNLNTKSKVLMDTFFELWTFINLLVKTIDDMNPVVGQHILSNVVDPFLVNVIGPNFQHSVSTVYCSRVMYFIDLLESTDSPLVYDSVVEMLIKPTNPNEASILETLIDKINDPNDDMGLVSLQLFDCLINTCDVNIFNHILPNLFVDESYDVALDLIAETNLREEIKSFLDLVKLDKRNLNPNLHHFLNLLNPTSNSADPYFVEALSQLNQPVSSQVLSLPKRLHRLQLIDPNPIDPYQLPKLVQALMVGLVSTTNHQRLTGITGILVQLLRLPNSKIRVAFQLRWRNCHFEKDVKSAYPNTYSTLARTLHQKFHQLLSQLELEFELADRKLWDTLTIQSAYQTTPTHTTNSPDFDVDSVKPTSLVRKFSQIHLQRNQTNRNKDTLLPPHLQPDLLVKNLPSQCIDWIDLDTSSQGPRLNLLVYVDSNYHHKMVAYVTLLEGCKEIAANLVTSLNFVHKDIRLR